MTNTNEVIAPAQMLADMIEGAGRWGVLDRYAVNMAMRQGRGRGVSSHVVLAEEWMSEPEDFREQEFERLVILDQILGSEAFEGEVLEGKYAFAMIKPRQDLIGKVGGSDEEIDEEIVGKVGNELEVMARISLPFVDEKMVEGFYGHVKKVVSDEEWRRMVDYMTSGATTVLILKARELNADRNAPAIWRERIGKTNPKEADPGTIRWEFGVSLGLNSVHGSSNPEDACIESRMHLRSWLKVLREAFSEMLRSEIVSEN